MRINNGLAISIALLIAGVMPATVVATPVFLDQLRYFEGPSIGISVGAAMQIWSLAFIVACLHAVILGLPAYFLLKKIRMTHWWVSLIAGFVIGSAPFGIYTWPLGHANASYTAWDGHAMVEYIVNGVPTKAGWIQYFASIAGIGLLGMFSALAAWAVWRLLSRSAIHAST